MGEATPTHAGSYMSRCAVCNRDLWNADKRCRLCTDCAKPAAPTPEKDEGHLQTEFERYYGSPIVAWERWEAWQWAIDAPQRSRND
jgi:hypothetical protein